MRVPLGHQHAPNEIRAPAARDVRADDIVNHNDLLQMVADSNEDVVAEHARQDMIDKLKPFIDSDGVFRQRDSEDNIGVKMLEHNVVGADVGNEYLDHDEGLDEEQQDNIENGVDGKDHGVGDYGGEKAEDYQLRLEHEVYL